MSSLLANWLENGYFEHNRQLLLTRPEIIILTWQKKLLLTPCVCTPLICLLVYATSRNITCLKKGHAIMWQNKMQETLSMFSIAFKNPFKCSFGLRNPFSVELRSLSLSLSDNLFGSTHVITRLTHYWDVEKTNLNRRYEVVNIDLVCERNSVERTRSTVVKKRETVKWKPITKSVPSFTATHSLIKK